MHHHRINMDKYHPGYFGKLGMRNFHLNRNHNFCPTINLDKLWSLVDEKKRAELKEDKEGKVPVIDLVQFVSVQSCTKRVSFHCGGVLSDDTHLFSDRRSEARTNASFMLIHFQLTITLPKWSDVALFSTV